MMTAMYAAAGGLAAGIMAGWNLHGGFIKIRKRVRRKARAVKELW